MKVNLLQNRKPHLLYGKLRLTLERFACIVIIAALLMNSLLVLVVATSSQYSTETESPNEYDYDKEQNGSVESNEDDGTVRSMYKEAPQSNPPKKANKLTRSDIPCKFEGNVAIKNQCANFLHCSQNGLLSAPIPCPTGKYFDHILRICIGRTEARCQTQVVCPNEGHKMPDSSSTNGSSYLSCRNGVPYPTKCPSKQPKYNPSTKQCTSGNQGKQTDEGRLNNSNSNINSR